MSGAGHRWTRVSGTGARHVRPLMREEEEARTELTVLLRACGEMEAEQIADWFVESEIDDAIPGDCTECALALWLTQATGFETSVHVDDGVTTCVLWLPEQTERVVVPASVAEFVERFDRGDFPALVMT